MWRRSKNTKSAMYLSRLLGALTEDMTIKRQHSIRGKLTGIIMITSAASPTLKGASSGFSRPWTPVKESQHAA
jgi:hypothetical protein